LKSKFIIALVFVVSISFSGIGQMSDASAAKIKLKGIYMYQFARNVLWPDEFSKGDFVIGVYGDESVFQQFSKSYTNKLIGSQTIKVKYCSSLSELKDCHILFISSTKNGAINQINKNIDKQTLLVSESSNLASSGAIINFIFKDSKLKFELNKTKAEKNDLKVGQNLTKLAYNII
jgi:hypothetical protein